MKIIAAAAEIHSATGNVSHTVQALSILFLAMKEKAYATGRTSKNCLSTDMTRDSIPLSRA